MHEQKFKDLNFDNWKVRASGSSKIMSKSGKITLGVETYLKEQYNLIARGFKDDFSSKYTEKGNWKEQDNLDVISNTILKDYKFPIISNKETKSNDYIVGTCDIYLKPISTIIDAKNNWSWKSFDDADLSEIYEYQLRSYMSIWGCESAVLFYTLLNLPDHMISDMERKMFYSENKWATMESPEYIVACDLLRENWNFEKFDIKYRYKAFAIKRDLDIEQKMFNSVKSCRVWLNEYHQKVVNDASLHSTFNL